MPERASIVEISQIGPETTPGVAVPATRRLQSLSIQPTIKTATAPFQAQGFKYNTALSVQQEWSTAKITGLGDYTAAIYPLAGLFGAPTPVTPPTGVLTRDWYWNPSTTKLDTAQSYTVEAGQNYRAGRFANGLVTEFGVAYTRKDVKADGMMIGQRYQDSFTLTAPPSEAQTITVTGTPTGGTFTLTYNGQTTATIPYNAAASAVASALTALANIGAGNLTATGGPLGTAGVVATFAGTLAGQRTPLIVLGTNSLTGGTTPTVTITETTPGGMDVVSTPIFPTQVTCYIDTTAANLGVTALTRDFEASWKISNKFGPVWPINAANSSWAASVETDPKVEFKLLVEADASGMGLLGDFRLGTTKFLRFGAVGPVIEGSLSYTFNADFAARITAVDDFKDHEGVWAIAYTLEGFHDPVWGQSMAFFARNTALAL